METNELTNIFAKKGFLVDRESTEFFSKLENIDLAEEIINRIHGITNSRVISKKVLNQHFDKIRIVLATFDKTKFSLINNFFNADESNILKKEEIKPKEEQTEVKRNLSEVKMLSSNFIPYRKVEVKDFVNHFRNRYNFFKDVLKDKKELTNLVSINKIGNNRNFSVIGLVLGKRTTKNKNIILEIEDLTGKNNFLVSQDKENVLNKAKEIVLDDVIGLKCSGNGELIYVNDIVFSDLGVGEKKRFEEESYALFISDIHVGSKLFLKDSFNKFLDWINGVGQDEKQQEKIAKIKYIFLVGDNVDGVGIYPGQESLLEIKNMKEQYKELARLLKLIPNRINIIMCPGQHDAVRVPEPQPALDEEFAEELTKMNNVFLVSNPALIEIGGGEKKKGFKVLMYHGASIIRNWIDEIEELRLGQAHSSPSKVVKYILRHRHLSPSHSSNVYVPSEKEDLLIIKDTPDIITTGDLHKSDIDIYNNILIICCSCWQSMTPFEEKVGNLPDPCKVPMLNLKTRELKILDFT